MTAFLSKKRYQVLIDKHRAVLVDKLAIKHNVPPMVVVRSLAYRALREMLPQQYAEADAADQAAVANVVKGPKNEDLFR